MSRGGKGILSQNGKDFIDILEHLRPSKHAYEVFNDWLVLAAASLYSWKRDKAVEEEYLHIASQYSKEELENHGRLFAITVNALEENEGDFLGEVFTFAELCNSRTGQFFTPYHISHMMAKMTMSEKEPPQNRICKISDPCCGAGGMLIASAMAMKEMGLNFQQNALFVGTDIDARCARMAFIQLSLLGAPAVIICGDTLALKTYWQRETIGYHIACMDIRLRAEKLIDDAEKSEQPIPAQIKESEPVEVILPQKELVQGELF